MLDKIKAVIWKMDVRHVRTRIGTKLLGICLYSGRSMKKDCLIKV